MTKEERRAWLIVFVLVINLLIVFGPASTPGVFFPPLLKTFGWDRARLSLIFSVSGAGIGLSGLLVGWMLERIEARLVMSAGIFVAGLGLVVASFSHSFAWLFIGYLLFGVGTGGAFLVPCSFVVANWFSGERSSRRGLAMGIVVSAVSVGGMLLVELAQYVIISHGWHAAYLAMAAPMFAIALPLVAIVIRSRPADQDSRATSEHSTFTSRGADIPGLEVSEALKTRSFWFVAYAGFVWAFVAGAILVHVVTYMTGIGYSASTGALTLSIILGCTAVGQFFVGFLADSFGARKTMAVSYMVEALGIASMMGARNPIFYVLFLILYGSTWGAPTVLIPLLMLESLGLKRYGTLGGIVLGLGAAAGQAIGPFVLGRVYDVTGVYTDALRLIVILLILAAGVSLACVPLTVAEGKLSRRAAIV